MIGDNKQPIFFQFLYWIKELWCVICLHSNRILPQDVALKLADFFQICHAMISLTTKKPNANLLKNVIVRRETKRIPRKFAPLPGEKSLDNGNLPNNITIVNKLELSRLLQAHGSLTNRTLETKSLEAMKVTVTYVMSSIHSRMQLPWFTRLQSQACHLSPHRPKISPSWSSSCHTSPHSHLL